MKESTAKSTKSKDAEVPKRIRLEDESDELVFAVCERFFDPSQKTRTSAGNIASFIAEKYDRPDVNREKIYPLLWEALRRKFLLLHPPVEEGLRARLIEKYNLGAYLNNTDSNVPALLQRDLTVVNVIGDQAPAHVSSTAADKIIELIFQVEKEKKEKAVLKKGEKPDEVRVHIGVGSGYAAMEVAERLSSQVDAHMPLLTLHAIAPGGYYIEQPQMDTSVYFSNIVGKLKKKVQCIGFFSAPVTTTSNEELYQNPSLRLSFDRRDEIDILVTSLASSTDEHGLVRSFFKYMNAKDVVEENVIQSLEDQGWVGDVLFQPYSSTNAIYPKSLRTVALFDFNDLVKFSQKPNKRVVLIAGPCKDCSKSKTEALKPLLSHASMRLWTHLVLDRQTALELLGDEQA